MRSGRPSFPASAAATERGRQLDEQLQVASTIRIAATISSLTSRRRPRDCSSEIAHADEAAQSVGDRMGSTGRDAHHS